MLSINDPLVFFADGQRKYRLIRMRIHEDPSGAAYKAGCGLMIDNFKTKFVIDVRGLYAKRRYTLIK